MTINDKKRVYNKRWHEQNRDRVNDYREKTREKRNARRRELYHRDENMRRNAVKTAIQYHQKHPFAKKASFYGISRTEIERMLNGCCEICGAGQFDINVKLHIDHDHRTGKVRGVLCNNCNFAIGHLHDDPLLAASALRYLLKETKAHE